MEHALKLDEELIKLLLKNERIKGHFFKDVDGVLIFDKEKFMKFIDNKEFLPDSYTAFKNKIGLANEEGKCLAKSKEVVLVWPYKDCVLEGGQEKPDEKRKEILHNVILAPDEIDRLLESKVFTNFKIIDKDGEHTLEGFRRDPEINRKRGLPEDTITDNLIIKGNNLLVLHSLLKEFRGKVKLIYIDPPYNTGSDEFQYNDNFKHSTWLTFMKNRLEVAKELLREDGVIFVQCDINEQAHLKVLMDEIFNRKIQTMITVKVKSPSGDSSKITKLLDDVSEYILVYSKKDKFKNLEPISIKEIVDQHSKTASQYKYLLISKGRIGDKAFEFYIGRGENKTKIEVYRVEGFKIKLIPRNDRNSEFFVNNYENICRTAKFSGKFLEQFRGRKGAYYFKYTPTRGKNAGIEKEIYVYNGEQFIYLKDYSTILELDNGTKIVAKTETPTNLITDIAWQGIANEGGVTLAKGKKPEELIKRIIKWTTKDNDIILDFFIGTGTTCAVAHKMGRQYIGVEQLDYGENSAVVRLKNVINGDQTRISEEVGWQGGGDFVYMELMKLNESFIERIRDAETTEELLKIWEDMKHNGFLSYRIDPKLFDENIEEFKTLSLDEQKKLLLEMLEYNDLYVNYSEIDDAIYNVNDDDKKLNKEFYEGI